MRRPVLYLVGLALLSSAAAPQAPPPLTVCAAVSLTEALAAAADMYRAEGGGPVRFNFAGSNTLARQLVNGAPADLFISADEAQMDVVAAAGAIDRTTRVDLLSNRLAVIVAGDPGQLRDIRGLLDPHVRRVAIGDPAAVPAGVYARLYLQAVGIWEAVQPRVVPVGNVRAVVSAVDNGSADAGIVYETDAAIATRARTALVISGESAPRIVYPAALVTSSRQREAAARFLHFLRGTKGASVFRRYHFMPVSG
jgi:molybdate transport system substrate-binding protein